LLAKQDIPFWVDLGVVAAFALVIYYWASRVAMPTEFVRAVETVTDREAAVGEILPDAQATSVA
jgi:hypothetical protein